MPEELEMPEPARPTQVQEKVDPRRPVTVADRLAATAASDRHAPLRLDPADIGADGSPAGPAKDVLDSVSLFTAGNVDAVRDPSRYDPEAARGSIASGATYVGPDGRQRIHSVESPTRVQYERAREVLADMARAPTQQGADFFRGMSLPSAESLNPGSTFDLSAISSWSSALDVAESFTVGSETVVSGSAQGEAVVFRMKPRRGRVITPLSAFRGEDELVTGGEVRIVRRERIGDVWFVDVEQI